MVRFDTSPNQEQIEEPRLRPLYNDMVECERLLESEDSQFARRTFCRAAFAFIEGQVHWLRGIAMHLVAGQGIRAGTIELSLISALIDETPRVERNGKLKMEQSRTPFTNTVALVFRTLAEKLGLDAAEFFSDGYWGQLQSALDVRHRITHPKTAEDMEISDENMDHIRAGLAWFMNSTAKIANRQWEIQNGQQPQQPPGAYSSKAADGLTGNAQE